MVKILTNTDELIAEELGKKMPLETRKKISRAMLGPNNPAYKDGRRSYRRIAKAKPGYHVHHKDGDSTNNKPSNLELFPAKGPGRSRHEKKHNRAANFSSSGGRKTPPRGYKAKRLQR